jgi:hypothetical protein
VREVPDTGETGDGDKVVLVGAPVLGAVVLEDRCSGGAVVDGDSVEVVVACAEGGFLPSPVVVAGFPSAFTTTLAGSDRDITAATAMSTVRAVAIPMPTRLRFRAPAARSGCVVSTL